MGLELRRECDCGFRLAIICSGFGCGEPQESVEEPVRREFWKKAAFEVREEEQSLQMRLERNGEERRKRKRVGTREPCEKAGARSRGWNLVLHPGVAEACCVWHLGGRWYSLPERFRWKWARRHSGLKSRSSSPHCTPPVHEREGETEANIWRTRQEKSQSKGKGRMKWVRRAWPETKGPGRKGGAQSRACACHSRGQGGPSCPKTRGKARRRRDVWKGS